MASGIAAYGRPASEIAKRPRPVRADAEQLVGRVPIINRGPDGKLQRGYFRCFDPADVCPSNGRHWLRGAAVRCTDNSLNIEWKRAKARTARGRKDG